MNELNAYETKLLDNWEDTYKKSQLTIWIMLALKDGPKYMGEIKTFISQLTNNTLQADDKSMYRALRRYYDNELVNFESSTNRHGPDRKIYSLTSTGRKVLDRFTTNNITDVLYQPIVKKLIER